MAKILVLAESGFGKSTSLMKDEEYGIEGLEPVNSYIISATSKPLPGRGSRKKFPVLPQELTNMSITRDHLSPYRRVISNNGQVVAYMIELLGQVAPMRNIVVDDANYIMQDYYMDKALSTGWDAPKRIGYDMGKVFKAMNSLPEDKNFIMLAHGEEYEKPDGRKGYRFKTTGKMVNEYVTPEGKFDVVLIGRSNYDESSKKVVKEFVTNDDGVYTSAKSHRIFDSLYIPNDMGLVVKKVNEYYDEVEKKVGQ